MSRARYQTLAAETLAILDRGSYAAWDGREIDLSAALARSVRETITVTEAQPRAPSRALSQITLADETTRAGSERIASECDGVPAVLNFASARNPGGGFERGANALEEALCRDTTLFAALRGQKAFYAANKAAPDGIYRDAMLYSPSVTLIRDGQGLLRPDPIEIAVLTVPAPNLRALKDQGLWPARQGALETALSTRIAMMLTCAHARGHRALVLGAWGCGVFGNDPYDVAARFAAGLSALGPEAFDRVHFAIPAGGADDNLAAFRAVFGV